MGLGLTRTGVRACTRGAAAAEVFAVDVHRIGTAVSYYGDNREEIDAEIEAAEEASVNAERAWRVQQQLIA